jgi:arylsulfatase A-like enzyme
MKLALVGLLLLSGMEGVALWAAPPTLPNILLILVEDVGAWELGCYGGAAAETPNLDQMAEEGMRFSAAYAASCVAGPSRASVMTGQSPVRLRFTEDLRGGGVAGALQPAGSGAGLSGDDVTFAETLREAGYRTAYVGPWGLGLLRSAPALGAHGAEVLREAGYDEARISDLRSRSVIGG